MNSVYLAVEGKFIFLKSLFKAMNNVIIPSTATKPFSRFNRQRTITIFTKLKHLEALFLFLGSFFGGRNHSKSRYL